MKIADLPATEAERLEALRQTEVLDTPPEQAFDQLTALAARLCRAPIALITLVDVDRQWFKSRHGLDVLETSRDVAFCAHAILQEDLFVVTDTLLDERFADNPLVIEEPRIRFYAGSPLVTHDGHAIGTFCVIDRVPHELPEMHAQALRTLSRHTSAILQLRRTRALLARESAEWELAEKAGTGAECARALASLGAHFQQMIHERELADAELRRLEQQLQAIDVLESERSFEAAVTALEEPVRVIREVCDVFRSRMATGEPLRERLDELDEAAERAGSILAAVSRRNEGR